jgi:hypothetical protein
MFADEIRRAIEAATRLTLPQVTALLWRAYGEEKVSEAEAEELSELIDGRRSTDAGQNSGRRPNPTATAAGDLTLSPQDCAGSPRRAVDSRPCTDFLRRRSTSRPTSNRGGSAATGP